MNKISAEDLTSSLQNHKKKLCRQKVTPFNAEMYQYDILLLKPKDGKLRFSRLNLTEIHSLLSEAGFRVFHSASDIYLVRVQKNIVGKVTDQTLRNFILNHIKEYPLKFKVKYKVKDLSGEIFRAEVEQNFYLRQHYLFQYAYWSTLPQIEKPLLGDGPDSSYIFYRNKVVEVKRNKLNLLNYEDLKSHYVWENQIIDFDFEQVEISEGNSHFAQFIGNICDGDAKKVHFFESAIGFLLHSYSTPANQKAVICYDEDAGHNTMVEGGTGKSLLAKAIAQCRKVVRIDGKGFDSKDSFCFQDVNESTQIIWIDDPNANFQTERLNSVISEGLIGRRPYQNNFHLSATTGPKFIICSNYILKGRGTTFKRRQIILRFGNYYSSKIQKGTEMPVLEEHGCLFFEWNKEEFNRFYNYLIYCLQYYMNHGLLVYEEEVNEQRCKEVLDPVFYGWVSSIQFTIGNEYSIKEYYSIFLNAKNLDEDGFTQRRFTSSMRTYFEAKEYQVIVRKSNGFTFLKILEPKN